MGCSPGYLRGFQPFLSCFGWTGLPWLHVLPGLKAGVQAGDRLVSMNGQQAWAGGSCLKRRLLANHGLNGLYGNRRSSNVDATSYKIDFQHLLLVMLHFVCHICFIASGSIHIVGPKETSQKLWGRDMQLPLSNSQNMSKPILGGLQGDSI